MTKGLWGVEVAVVLWWACGPFCHSLAAWLALEKTYQAFSFETFCNLPFKTTIKLVSRNKLLVHLSPLKLDAVLGMVTAIQKK